MTTDVDRALIRIEATTEQLRRQLRQGDQSVAKFQKSVDRKLGGLDKRFNKLGAGLSKSLAGLATVAVAGGLATFVRRTIAAADSLEDTADAAGVAIERYQSLRFAAEQAGLGTQRFDEGMARLSRRIGLFAQDGGGPAAKAFRELNIAIADSAGNIQPTGAIFDQIVTKLQGVENQSRRTALASQFFGDRVGGQFTLLLNKGGEGIEQLEERARRLGIVLKEDVVRDAGRANDAINTLSSVIGAQFSNAVLQNADDIARLSQAFADAIPNIIAATEDLAKFFGLIDEDAPSLEQAQKDLAGYRAELERLRNMPAIGGRGGGAQAARIIDLNRQIAQQEALIADLEAKAAQAATAAASQPGGSVAGQTGGGAGQGADQMAGAFGSAAAAVARLEQEYARLTATSQSMSILSALGVDPDDPAADRIVALSQKVEGLRTAQDRLSAARRSAQAVIDANLSGEERLAEEKQRLASLLPTITELTGSEARARELINRAIERQTELLDKTEERLVQTSRLSEQFGQAAAGAFEEAALSGESLGNILKGLAEDIARLALRQALLQPLAGAISGGITSVLGFKDGGQVKGFASGGYVSGRGGPRDDKIPAMLSNGEYVINAAATRKFRPLLERLNTGTLNLAGGGMVSPTPVTGPPSAGQFAGANSEPVTVNMPITYNMPQEAVAVATEATVRALLPQIEQRVLATVARARTRRF